MIHGLYGYYSCNLDDEKFQVLIEQEPVWNEYTQEWEQVFIWDEQASSDLSWEHWYDVHDKDQDGVLDQ